MFMALIAAMISKVYTYLQIHHIVNIKQNILYVNQTSIM